MSEGLLFHWTDKEGKRLSGKEFLKRWRDGMEQVTPLQQAKIQLFNYVPILAGILFGLVASGLNHTWWLFIILIGSFGITCVQTLGVWQRYRILKKVDDELKSIQQEQKEVEDARTNKEEAKSGA